MTRVIRPWLPRLRNVVVARLAAADPAMLEAFLGAGASACEAIVAHAPGDPLPRYVLAAGADGRPTLAPHG